MRPTSTFAIAAPISALFALSACSSSSVVPRTTQRAMQIETVRTLPVDASFVIPGEQLRWKLSMHGVEGGELVMAAGQPGKVNGHRAVIIRSRASTSGVFALFKKVIDEVTVQIDLDSSYPFHHVRDTREGKKREHVVVSFAHGGFDIREQSKNDISAARQILPAGESSYDLTSALMALRGWDANPGERGSFYVLRSTMVWRSSVEFGGRESIKTSYGRFPAVRIDGVSKRATRSGELDKDKEARFFSMWFSDDAQRLPLLVAAKTDYGDIKMELSDYTPGK